MATSDKDKDMKVEVTTDDQDQTLDEGSAETTAEPEAVAAEELDEEAMVEAARAAGEAAAEAKDNFDVVLEGFGDNKLQVVKAVKELSGLGLKEAKDLVENVPSTILEGAKTDDANAAKEKLEAAGAAVTLK